MAGKSGLSVFARRAAILTALSMTTLGSTAAGAQSDKDTLVVGFANEATTLDPSRLNGTADRFFIFQMFELLIQPDRDGKIVPWLAEKWDIVQESGKTRIDVTLRPGLKFHNGDPVTSEDFEFSFLRESNPKISRGASRHSKVERFEVIDDRHFSIHFKEPDGGYIASYLHLTALPKKYFEQVGDEGFLQHPIGTGPWKFVSRKPGQEIRFALNEDYWNKENMPKIKNLVIRVIPEELTRVAAFKNGEVDWIDNVPLPLVEEFKSMPGVTTFSAHSGNNLYFDFPQHDPKSPFHDLRVRRAVAMGFDMDAIIKNVLYGQGRRYTGVGTSSIGYDPDVKPYAYNPQEAKKLLAEAGYPNGFDTPCYNMTTQREPSIKEMGEAIYAYLQTIEVRCQVRNVEYGAWVELIRRSNNKLDGITTNMSSQGIPSDPGNSWAAATLHSYKPDIGFGAYSHSEDPEADRLVVELQSTMDLGKRAEVIRRAGRYKYENLIGGIPTYEPIMTMAWRDNIDFKPWPFPGYWRAFQEVSFKH
jgi:peptide/nickel transport system substrate-binding protein